MLAAAAAACIAEEHLPEPAAQVAAATVLGQTEHSVQPEPQIQAVAVVAVLICQAAAALVVPALLSFAMPTHTQPLSQQARQH
jgi:hypothetical protein